MYKTQVNAVAEAKCISVLEELPASNIRAASLQMQIQLHQITWDHIPQGKIRTEEISMIPHPVCATVKTYTNQLL
jgi:hypothetical protein